MAEAEPQKITKEHIAGVVAEVLASTSFIDIHTHLFAPQFGSLGLWGIDELLTYHYLEAELFRFSPIRPQQYFALTKTERADLIWKTLFVENTPLSEATRGVVAVLSSLGLEQNTPCLKPLREFFAAQKLSEYVPRVFELAGISDVVMTNDPLDPVEAPLWTNEIEPGPHFHAALRIDRILNEWDAHSSQVGTTMPEVQQFLLDWSKRMRPVYMAVSLPDTFEYPADDMRTQLLRSAVLPACRELNIPLALMIGVRRQVNPALQLAGDAAGKADLRAVETLCREFPDNRFLVTVLSRENQHELCIYARKFGNLMPFGCWWFLNIPSVVEEITRERLEMLGTSFIPQHSDARILEQVIYKWRNTRRTLAPLLSRTFELLADDGGAVTRPDIQATVTRLFSTNFSLGGAGIPACLDGPLAHQSR
jgi:hypothetical protein